MSSLFPCCDFLQSHSSRHAWSDIRAAVVAFCRDLYTCNLASCYVDHNAFLCGNILRPAIMYFYVIYITIRHCIREIDSHPICIFCLHLNQVGLAIQYMNDTLVSDDGNVGARALSTFLLFPLIDVYAGNIVCS